MTSLMTGRHLAHGNLPTGKFLCVDDLRGVAFRGGVGFAQGFGTRRRTGMRSQAGPSDGSKCRVLGERPEWSIGLTERGGT
jgi:hypothetical protein